MLKTIIVLPDGREISSGIGTVDAVQSLSFTEAVNDDRELSLGATCAAMVEVRFLTPGGRLSIMPGEELAVYREDEQGVRYKIGLFTAEQPTRPSANTLHLTAFDRVSWLDRDLTRYLASLDQWPYRLVEFARMVCSACGLTLENETLPNGDYLVQRFSADGITGRQLMRWVGQIAGRFCRATPQGGIEFAWYTPREGYCIGVTPGTDSGVAVRHEAGSLLVISDTAVVTEDGDSGILLGDVLFLPTDDGAGNAFVSFADAKEVLPYYRNSLGVENYQVAPIEKVQLRQNEEDVGTVYPDTAAECNTYTITGNYLLSAAMAETLEPVAETLYEQLKDLSYTPCRVELPATMQIRAGDILSVKDQNGKVITVYVMSRTQSGQKDTLECTGSYIRSSSTAVNNQSFRAFTGKMLNLRTDVEGMKAENRDAAGNLAQLRLEVEGISTEVVKQQQDTGNLKKAMTQVQQDAKSIYLQVQQMEETGIGKLKTGKGYTFDDEGLKIRDVNGQIENRLDHTGMYVTRVGGILLQANNDGVEAVDITVRNYLKVGDHARFEDYTQGADSDRTACFFT